jgi:hypothetical protein
MGSVPNTPGYSALGVVLEAVAASFGQQDRILFREVLEALNNPADAPLLAALRASNANHRPDGEP